MAKATKTRAKEEVPLIAALTGWLRTEQKGQDTGLVSFTRMGKPHETQSPYTTASEKA
jgi:hypothetical protein